VEPRDFIVIENDMAAQKLAASWDRLTYTGTDTFRLYDEWAARAGVYLADVFRCAPMLHASSICLTVDGHRVVDPLALQFIQAQLLQRMQRGSRLPPRPAPPPPKKDDKG
jgi:hypothetical protein